MRPIAKPFLTVTVIVVCLLVVTTLLLNIWLRLPSTRESLASMVRLSLGTDVSFGSLYVLPWGEICAGGITSQKKDSPVRFTADHARISASILSMLRGRISVTSCSLDRPVLTLSVYPPATVLPDRIAGSPVTFNLGTGSPVRTGPATVFPAGAIPSGLEEKSPVPILSPGFVLSVRNGEFRLTEASAKTILLLTEVSFSGGFQGGKLNAEKAVLGNTLIFRNLAATLVRHDDCIVMRDLRASIGGGTLTGDLGAEKLLAQKPEYRLGVTLQGADLNHLLADAACPSTSAKGSVSGTLSLEGVPGQGSTMHGEGTLLLRDASLQPVDFLRQIGRILSIEELQLLRISEGKCLFRIESGKFRMDDLHLRSDNLMLAAKGPVNENGELDLQTRILFNTKLTSRLQGILGSQLSPAPEAGYSQISFHVTGPVLNPRTDLLERLTGIRIGGDFGGLGNLLQGLFSKPTPSQPSR